MGEYKFYNSVNSEFITEIFILSLPSNTFWSYFDKYVVVGPSTDVINWLGVSACCLQFWIFSAHLHAASTA